MKSPKNLAIVLLAVLAGGGAALAWKQHLELVPLRAGALTNAERADLQKRLWDAQKRAKDLADELAALRGQQAGDDGEMAATDESGNQNNQHRRAGGRRGGQNGGPGGRFGNAAAVFESPAVQKLMQIQQKGALDARYAQLFKSLDLSPEQLDKLKTLMVERQTAMQDVIAAARAEGINPGDDREAFRKMLASTQAEVDNSIKAVLGEEGFAKYQNYQETIPQRSTVNQLQQSLSYSGTPLSDAQAEQLVQILSQNSARNLRAANGAQAQPATTGTDFTFEVTASADGGGARGGNNGRGGGGGGGPMFAVNFGGGGGAGGGAQVTDQAITAAQGVLSPQQVQALQQLQAQQQAQQQLQQTIRQSMESQRSNGGTGGRNNTGTNTGGTTTTPNTGTTTAAPNRRG